MSIYDSVKNTSTTVYPKKDMQQELKKDQDKSADNDKRDLPIN